MEQTSLTKNELNYRLYGLDLLKVLAVFYVVILHTLVHGGVINALDTGSVKYHIAMCMEVLAYPAVDIFALISGYLSIHIIRTPKRIYARLLLLWTEVVFYNIVIAFILHTADPGLCSFEEFIYGLFPVTTAAYWYFTAFFATTIISPVIIQGILNLSDSFLRYLFWIIIIVFSVADTVADKFVLGNGFSFVWIMLLFIEGAIIKKTGLTDSLTKKQSITIIAGLYVITYISSITEYEYSVANRIIDSDILLSYTSPSIVIIAVMYLSVFKSISMHDHLQSIVRFAAEGVFAVYLLNDNYLLLNHYLYGSFVGFAEYNAIKMIMCISGFSAAFSVISIIIDKPRQWLFNTISSHIGKKQ